MSWPHRRSRSGCAATITSKVATAAWWQPAASSVSAALLAVAAMIASDIRARTTGGGSQFADRRNPEGGRLSQRDGGRSDCDTTVTLTRPYSIILVDAAAGDVVVTLPAAALCSWQQVGIQRTDAAAVYNVTIMPHGPAETIDGQNDKHVQPNQAVSLYSNGTAWSTI